jgi:hypothetical protein
MFSESYKTAGARLPVIDSIGAYHVRGTADWMFRMASPGPRGSTLAAFNAAPPEAAERDLLGCCASGSFAKAITDGRPYPGPTALQSAVDTAFRSLSSAGSEFWGFARDRYTTLAETTDRPYGLIEGTVTRDDAPPAGKAW